MNHSRSRS